VLFLGQSARPTACMPGGAHRWGLQDVQVSARVAQAPAQNSRHERLELSARVVVHANGPRARCLGQ